MKHLTENQRDILTITVEVVGCCIIFSIVILLEQGYLYHWVWSMFAGAIYIDGFLIRIKIWDGFK